MSINDYSRRLRVYPIKRKSNVFQYSRNLKHE